MITTKIEDAPVEMISYDDHISQDYTDKKSHLFDCIVYDVLTDLTDCIVYYAKENSLNLMESTKLLNRVLEDLLTCKD